MRSCWLGVMGLFLEATHPWVFLPGIAGGILLAGRSVRAAVAARELRGARADGARHHGLLAAEAVLPTTVGALGIGGLIAIRRGLW